MRKGLIVLLGLGVVAGYGSALGSFARHRGACHGRWDEGQYGYAPHWQRGPLPQPQVAPAQAAPAPVVVPAPAAPAQQQQVTPQIIIVQPSAPAAAPPTVVVQPSSPVVVPAAPAVPAAKAEPAAKAPSAE